jgi:hypothetical protein
MRFCIVLLGLVASAAFAQQPDIPCEKIRGNWKVARVDRDGGCEVHLNIRGKTLGTGTTANCESASVGDVWTVTCGKDDPDPEVRNTLRQLGILEQAAKFTPKK